MGEEPVNCVEGSKYTRQVLRQKEAPWVLPALSIDLEVIEEER